MTNPGKLAHMLLLNAVALLSTISYIHFLYRQFCFCSVTFLNTAKLDCYNTIAVFTFTVLRYCSFYASDGFLSV
ncbi:unnamed protein product [Rhodiola kirilowii]